MKFQTKTIIFGHHAQEIDELIQSKGFIVIGKNKNDDDKVHEKPDVIISYGGDGTLILSEFFYPGIPKIVLKSSRICKMCEPFSNEEILDRFQSGKYEINKMAKIKANVFLKNGGEKNLIAINEILMHNSDPRHAIRYQVNINDKPFGGSALHQHEIIGDGIVASTPFGSSGYFKSITGCLFTTGLGIAFNNSTEQSDHIVLDEHDTVRIKITRGPATIYADNQEEFITIDEGDELIIKKSKELAHIVKVGI